jgi:hypothetical protein
MMETDQRNARMFGALFIVTFLTSIPAALIFQSIVDDPAGYIAGSGNDNVIYLAVLLEFVLIIANVGTAVVLYPIHDDRTKFSPSATSPLESSSASSLPPESSLCSG